MNVSRIGSLATVVGYLVFIFVEAWPLVPLFGLVCYLAISLIVIWFWDSFAIGEGFGGSVGLKVRNLDIGEEPSPLVLLVGWGMLLLPLIWELVKHFTGAKSWTNS